MVPKAQGVTALGVYILFTVIMVFIALFEYAFILYQRKHKFQLYNRLDEITLFLYLCLLILFNITFFSYYALLV